jgi:short-subunit dehydrogenase
MIGMDMALITGASSGIGLELAKIMAEKGHNLLLVARRASELQALKQEIEGRNKITVEIFSIDLSNQNAAKSLYEYCKQKNFEIDCLINNAGYGDYGKFDPNKGDVYQNMLQLNIMSLTEITALFLKEMKARGNGRILNVGSIAAFLPMPNLAAYAASKAYVMQFTEALSFELRGTGVSATLLSPGVTETGFVKRANMGEAANAKKGLMSAKTVAQAGYDAMMARKLNITPGWKNKLMTFGSKTLPSREMLLRIANSVVKDTSNA